MQTLIFIFGTSAKIPYNAFANGIMDDDSTDNRDGINNLIIAINAAGGGVLYFPYVNTGIYRVSDGIDLLANVTLSMAPGTVLENQNNTAGVDKYTVKVTGNSHIIGATIRHVTPANNWEGAEIYLSGIGEHFLRENPTYLQNIQIQTPTSPVPDQSVGVGVGIRLHSDGSEFSSYINWVSFSNIYLHRCYKGIEILAEGADGGGAPVRNSFVTGCLFNNIFFNRCKFGVYMAGDTTWNKTSGNNFNNLQWETSGGSETMLEIMGGRNSFINVMCWDWDAANGGTGGAAVNFANNSSQNYVAINGSLDNTNITGETDQNIVKFSTDIAACCLYTTANIGSWMPPATHAGHVAYIVDGDTGDPCLAVCDGTSWRRISLGTAVASS